MIDRIDKRVVFKWLNNRPYFHGETEPCINGRILAVGAYFKKPNHALAKQLLREQLEDGGWNCEAVEPTPKRPKAALFVSYHHMRARRTTLNTSEQGENRRRVAKARKRAEEYLLERRMFRSLRTGDVIDERWVALSFPTFWHYDVLRGVDYLRNAGIKPDQPRPRSHRSRDSAPTPERPMAAQPASSRTYSVGDGNRCRKRKPLEHAARPPRTALVRQRKVIVEARLGSTVTWVRDAPRMCRRGLRAIRKLSIGPSDQYQETRLY